MKNQSKPVRGLIASAVGVAAASLSFGAHADGINGIVDVWEVTVDTVFNTTTICDSNDDCTAPTGVTVVNNKSLRWGTSTGSGQSGLDIGSSPITTVNPLGTPVDNVSITHLNNPITGTTLKSLDILSTLTLMPFSPPGAALPATTITFGVKYLETPNDADPCADGGVNGVGVNIRGCADIYVTDATSLNFPFTYDLDGSAGPLPEKTYFISFFESTSGLNSLPGAACESVLDPLHTTPGLPACLGFRTPEDATTTVRFAALITTTPVSIPEPATSALLGIGLLGGLLARRRRS